MAATRSLKIIFVLILIVAVCGLWLLVHIYRNDIKALRAFLAAYENFDKVLPADAEKARLDGLGPAGEALAELRAKGLLRISSLIVNEDELMNQAREVADFALQEFERLRLGLDAGPIRDQRKSAFARFLELGRTKGAAVARVKE